MAKIRKLTPSVLKRIIKEEKSKIAKAKNSARKKSINENAVDSLTRLALKEIKVLLEIKRIRKKRQDLKKKITRKMK